MAIIKCLECSNEISNTAKSCPKCGWVIPKRKVWPWVLGIPFAIVLLLMAYGSTVPDYKVQAIQVKEVCEKIATPAQKHICQDQYNEAIRSGKARNAP